MSLSPYKGTPSSGDVGKYSFMSVESMLAGEINTPPNPWANRFVILCKDQQGRIGMRVQSYRKGVFVIHVSKGSPAAMGGLRFGDQILTLNRTCLAGWTDDQVHERLKRCPVNNIVLAVRDRPLSRSLILCKNPAGLIGIKITSGKITGISKDSSAAKNGLLLGYYIIELNGVCTVGITDYQLRTKIDASENTVSITIMDSEIYTELTRNMAQELLTEKMNRE